MTDWASGLVMREVAAFFDHRERPLQGICGQARETAIGSVADLRVPVHFAQICPEMADSLRGKFFLLVFGASLPFYAVGLFAPQLKRLMPLGLPISALMTFVPVGVALWLIQRDEGQAGVRRLLGRVLDYHSPNKLWLLLSVGIMPAAMLLPYAVQQQLDPSLPQPAWSSSTVVLSFGLYFFGAIGEELGWTGYATDPLQRRYGFLSASMRLGLLWWLWHVIPYHVTGRSTAWILWQGLATVMFRVVMVWIYNHAGRSVLTAILFHAAINTSIDAVPLRGSHYNPKVTGLVLLGMTLLVAVWRAARPPDSRQPELAGQSIMRSPAARDSAYSASGTAASTATRGGAGLRAPPCW